MTYFEIKYKGKLTQINMDVFSNLVQDITEYLSTLGNIKVDNSSLEELKEIMAENFSYLFNPAIEVFETIKDEDDYFDAVSKIVNINCRGEFIYPCMDVFFEPLPINHNLVKNNSSLKNINKKILDTFLKIYNEKLAKI